MATNRNNGVRRPRRNSFYRNSSLIFKKVSKNIADKNLDADWDIIENTLLFAIGIEKLLKSILYDINPLYILEQPDFKNSAPLHYGEKVINNFELKKNPDADVIAYQSSVLRCVPFSKTILDNKNTLMSLKHYRDIIVHHNFDKLDISSMKTLLNRDYYPFLSELSNEHNLAAQGNFFNNLHSKLAKISGNLQNDIETQIKLKIDSTKSKWTQMSGSSSFNMNKPKKETLELLKKEFIFPTTCPSCNNHALVFTVPIMEYDAYQKDIVQTGLETKGLECKFCNLELLDYKELDFLNIKPDAENKECIIEEYSEE